jgi:hypothetical protein
VKPDAARLAGFFAAHAIWCVSDGGPLIPILAVELGDGTRQVNRLLGDKLAQGVEMGRQWLESNHFSAQRAVLVADGFVTLPSGRIDALLLDVRDYCEPPSSFSMAVPYRVREHQEGFAVFRPKFVAYPGASGEADYEAAASAFFAGVDEHEEGAKVWNAHIDQTL